MAENIQKYENWRAITESDYVTMFIKTWFAFVATLRELYPKDSLDDIIGKGDKAFLNPYLEHFQSRYLPYNTIDKVRGDILRVYKLGRKYTLENKKYNRFFAEDFYAVNESYLWEKTTEDYECSIRFSSKYKISVHIKYLDKKLYLDNKPLIISEKIDISDLISSANLTDSQIRTYLDDEAAYIDYVTHEITNRVSIGYISKITNGEFDSKYSPGALARLNALTLSVNAEFILALSLMKDSHVKKENLLFAQSPCNNFIYKSEDGADIPKIDTYKWFLKFVYFMRNALFHEIIDPLDAFWQEIFKHSYLVLKEILDGNINYFLEKENVIELILAFAWNELFNKIDDYVPNFNENYNNGGLEIKIIDYTVDDRQISLKATLSLDYWYDKYSLKQMNAVCKAAINREKMVISEIKMERTSLIDI